MEFIYDHFTIYFRTTFIIKVFRILIGKIYAFFNSIKDK